MWIHVQESKILLLLYETLILMNYSLESFMTNNDKTTKQMFKIEVTFTN